MLHLVSTGDDSDRLDRMEQGFKRALGSAVDVRPIRLGHVGSLRVAYHNAARLIGDRNSLLMFVHQDVEPVTSDMLSDLPVQMRQQLRPLLVSGPHGPLWWQILNQLASDDQFGFAGVAGSRETERGKAWWQHEALGGMVTHRRDDGIRVNAYGRWGRVVTVDGLCMICKASTLLDMPPEQRDQGHFHFYDHDFCLTAHSRDLTNWTLPLLLLHDSGGAAISDPKWQQDQVWFETKHQKELPASVSHTPLPGFAE
jgi:Glycosyltransferase like family